MSLPHEIQPGQITSPVPVPGKTDSQQQYSWEPNWLGRSSAEMSLSVDGWQAEHNLAVLSAGSANRITARLLAIDSGMKSN